MALVGSHHGGQVGGTMAPAGERAGERGSVAIVVGLALTLLLGFAALVVDVGLSWAVRVDCSCWREGEARPAPTHGT